MPDGSRWDVPIMIIAKDRASTYAHEFDGNEEQSLRENTEPLFEDNAYEIKDWAMCEMNWKDVKEHAKPAPPLPASKVDWEDGWTNGKKEIV